MRNRKENLEDYLRSNTSSTQFKSQGEKKIASFLEENGIKYKYESGILIHQADKKQRIWYPDFALPEFSTYIEYYGMVGNPDYDRGIKVKESTYSKMGLDVIPVYPHMFSNNWQGYIVDEIKRKIQRQYDKLSSIPFNAYTTTPLQNSIYNDDLSIDF